MQALPAYGRTPGIPAGPDESVVNAEQIGRVGVWVYIGWLTTSVIEGPLRGGLAAVGLANIIYLRDLALVLTVAVAFVLPVLRGTRHAPGLVLMGWLLALHLCIGLLMGGTLTLFDRLFGVKIFMPMLFTVAIFPAVDKHFRLFVQVMAVFFVISAAGVFLNDALGEMPWEGLTYDTAFGQVETTKKWWMDGGLRRLSGFARASFDAAMILGLGGAMLMALARAWWLRLLIAAIGCWAILLTTSKGMVLAYLVAALWLVPTNRSRGSLAAGRSIVILLLLIACLVPTLFMIMSVPEFPVDIPPLLSSLWDRFSWMWPSAFALLPDWFGAFTGAGLGGIGMPLGLIPVPNTADSIFVYYYISFGLLGILYLAFPVVAILGRKAQADPRSFVWAGLLVIAYGYGLSANMVEQSFFTSVFGLLYGKAFAVSRQ